MTKRHSAQRHTSCSVHLAPETISGFVHLEISVLGGNKTPPPASLFPTPFQGLSRSHSLPGFKLARILLFTPLTFTESFPVYPSISYFLYSETSLNLNNIIHAGVSPVLNWNIFQKWVDPVKKKKKKGSISEAPLQCTLLFFRIKHLLTLSIMRPPLKLVENYAPSSQLTVWLVLRSTLTAVPWQEWQIVLSRWRFVAVGDPIAFRSSLFSQWANFSSLM